MRPEYSGSQLNIGMRGVCQLCPTHPILRRANISKKLFFKNNLLISKWLTYLPWPNCINFSINFKNIKCAHAQKYTQFVQAVTIYGSTLIN